MVEWNETPLLIYNYQLTFVYAGNNKFLANRNKKKTGDPIYFSLAIRRAIKMHTIQLYMELELF